MFRTMFARNAKRATNVRLTACVCTLRAATCFLFCSLFRLSLCFCYSTKLFFIDRKMPSAASELKVCVQKRALRILLVLVALLEVYMKITTNAKEKL